MFRVHERELISLAYIACSAEEDSPRVVLVIDFWHPDFSDDEVKFLSYLNNAQINTAKLIHKASVDAGTALAAGEDDFFSVIENVRRLGHPVNPRLVWGSDVRDD
jgi:hypothetical protein